MKRIMAIILAVLMLAGCQLASEEKKDDRTQDKLVGMFVTFEHLNLDFDMEGLLEDHPEALHGDGVVMSDPEFVQYAGKLPVTVSDDGWVVPGYEGLSFGRLVKEDYSTTIASKAVSFSRLASAFRFRCWASRRSCRFFSLQCAANMIN